jgi:hypothetical protein
MATTSVRHRGVRVAALVTALLAASVGLVGQAGPASATPSEPACFTNVVGGPGAAASSVQLTYVAGVDVSDVVVDVYDQEPIGPVAPILTVSGSATGAEATVPLPLTTYWLEVHGQRAGGDCYLKGYRTAVSSSASSGTNLWVQAYGRGTKDAICDAGWWGSYAEWPNGGRGGWTWSAIC